MAGSASGSISQRYGSADTDNSIPTLLAPKDCSYSKIPAQESTLGTFNETGYSIRATAFYCILLEGIMKRKTYEGSLLLYLQLEPLHFPTASCPLPPSLNFYEQ